MNIDFIVNILVHMLIILIILTIFFWSFISKKETTIITNEFVNNVNRGFDSLKENLNPEQKMRVQEVVETVSPGLQVFEKYFQRPDKSFLEKNKCLKRNNLYLIYFFIILIFTICLIYHFSSGKDVHFFTILKENIIILLVIGVFEYLFFKEIADKFIPIKPSYLSNLIHAEIDKQFNLNQSSLQSVMSSHDSKNHCNHY